jgi:hypothetical protein
VIFGVKQIEAARLLLRAEIKATDPVQLPQLIARKIAERVNLFNALISGSKSAA